MPDCVKTATNMVGWGSLRQGWELVLSYGVGSGRIEPPSLGSVIREAGLSNFFTCWLPLMASSGLKSLDGSAVIAAASSYDSAVGGVPVIACTTAVPSCAAWLV